MGGFFLSRKTESRSIWMPIPVPLRPPGCVGGVVDGGEVDGCANTSTLKHRQAIKKGAKDMRMADAPGLLQGQVPIRIRLWRIRSTGNCANFRPPATGQQKIRAAIRHCVRRKHNTQEVTAAQQET
jgi:hypothetical protein